MFDRDQITEEFFGILTDDNLALEATLVRPVRLPDRRVQSVQVWLPKYPLTMSSVLPAARREVMAAGPDSTTVNLVFDLRGTGESDGIPSVEGFSIDVHSAQEWARERFGDAVVFRVLGFPDLGLADHLVTLPLRPGVMAELYCYNSPVAPRACVLYFSRYTSFDRDDDALCRAIAAGGYTVYGGDLMRYLLLAGPLTVETLSADSAALFARLGQPLFLVARSLAAGPALLMSALSPAVAGVVVTGQAQEGLLHPFLFDQDNPAQWMLSRQLKALSPRPTVFLWNQAETGSQLANGLRTAHDHLDRPRLWGEVRAVDGPMLLNALSWLAKQG